MKRKTTGEVASEPATSVIGSGDGATTKPSADGRPRGGNGAAAGIGTEGGMGMGGGGAAISFAGLRTFESFKVPAFRLYYLAMLGQMAAMNMQMMAKALLVYRLTGSATLLGVMALANSLPMLFFSLFGGVMADRARKKYVLLAGELVSALLILAVALSLTLGYLSVDRSGSWWILVVASFGQGTIMGLMMPSRQAIIPELVGTEQVMNAMALYTFGMNILRLLAPALTGFLIDWVGFDASYYVMAGMYLWATLFVWFLPITGTMPVGGGRGALGEMKAGFAYVRRDATIFMVLVVTLVFVFLSMPYMQLLPVFTEDVLKVGATGMGVLISVSGIGATVGSLVLASLPNKRRGALLILGTFLLGLALVGFSFSTIWSLSLVTILFVGLGQAARMTLAGTLLQYYVQDEYRGRVMSIYMMEFGLTSFAVFIAGAMTDVIGIQWAVGGMAIALVIFCPVIWAFVPRLRKLD